MPLFSSVCVCWWGGGGCGWVLDIRNLRHFNKALQGKLLWQFSIEREVLWRQVIEANYGCECGGWCTNSVPSAYGVSLWKTIRQGWPTLSRYIQHEVGDGTCVKYGVGRALWLFAILSYSKRLVWLILWCSTMGSSLECALHEGCARLGVGVLDQLHGCYLWCIGRGMGRIGCIEGQIRFFSFWLLSSVYWS